MQLPDLRVGSIRQKQSLEASVKVKEASVKVEKYLKKMQTIKLKIIEMTNLLQLLKTNSSNGKPRKNDKLSKHNQSQIKHQNRFQYKYLRMESYLLHRTIKTTSKNIETILI